MKQPQLPMITIENNLDLMLKHDVFLAFKNLAGPGLSILGSDNSRSYILEYCANGLSCVVLELFENEQHPQDAEPFYMNHKAVIMYLKRRKNRRTK